MKKWCKSRPDCDFPSKNILDVIFLKLPRLALFEFLKGNQAIQQIRVNYIITLFI